VVNLFAEGLDHTTAVRGGLLEEECAAVLGEFFQARR
jgi:tRNA(Arg) A34 adenosine deaminase TadA